MQIHIPYQIPYRPASHRIRLLLPVMWFPVLTLELMCRFWHGQHHVLNRGSTMMSGISLPVRGVHIDCRAQMLRFDRIRTIFKDLVRWGYNAVLFEYEDHFPYSGRLKSIASGDALTHFQVKELDRIASDLGLQIIPLVQCLGHLAYVLRLQKFRRLSEGYPKTQPYAVCPADPGSRRLFREMAEQVIEAHPGCRYFHLGGDEVKLDPSCPRCRDVYGRASESEKLVSHYLDRADWMRSMGPDPILWGDLIFAHPEHRDRLRGHAIIMDWDYWSGTKPAPAPQVLWGMRYLPGIKPNDPKTWPPLSRKLFESAVFTEDGRKARPFPYSSFLHNEGQPFMVATAARCSGDSFCVPAQPLHSDNVVGGVRASLEQRALGYVITSWSVRRSPWPLTEHSLIAGSMALRHPGVSGKAIDRAFAREHFGVADASLGQIPRLLGAPAPAFLQSMPLSDLKTNEWLACRFDKRLEQSRTDIALSLRQLSALRRNCEVAKRLLGRARPRTAYQRERVTLWRWAIRVLSFYAEHGPLWLKGEKPARSLTAMGPLVALTRRVLGRIYTDETVSEEIQTRFGSLADYLEGRAPRDGQVSG